MEGPARDREDAEDRNAHGEDDRQHVLDGQAVPAEEQCGADAGGEGGHPGLGALRDDDEAERADAETGHQRRGDDLRVRADRGVGADGKAEPQGGAQGDVADHQPRRDAPARSPDAGDRLGPGELHRAEIEAGDSERPRQEPGGGDLVPQVDGHHQRGDDVGGGEERGELGARNELHVAQGRAFGIGLATGEAGRFTARKPGRNQSLVSIWSFVHPPAVSRMRAGVDKDRLRAVKGGDYLSSAGGAAGNGAEMAHPEPAKCAKPTLELQLVKVPCHQRVIERLRLGIDAFRDRLAPGRVLVERPDQRPDELPASL